MIKLIVTGHGEFAQGMLQASQMIAGKQDHVSAVLFEDGMNLEDYQSALVSAMQDNADNFDGVVFFTDLKGGTPFNISMMLSVDNENVAVISGTNLPMLIEGSLLSLSMDNLDEFVEGIMIVGQTGIERGSLTMDDIIEDNSEDGI